MNHITMQDLGITDKLLAEAAHYPHLSLGRVSTQSKILYRIITENGELTAETSGKLRFLAQKPADFPAVGDFVLLDRATDIAGNSIIHQILPRRSVFSRKAAGTVPTEQIIAANIDQVFICMALNHDFNLRRLERYLSIGWSSGAVPVIVLTKADLCADLNEKLQAIDTVALGALILVTSGLLSDGCQSIQAQIKPGQTVAFIGSSGVGKSTLINRLLGNDALQTGAIRSDDRGRHTTTHRELLLLPAGGVVIDTPGMRELGLDSADLAQSFADIDILAQNCRFRDCTHSREPGCAVRQAVADGLLSDQRLESYFKLAKETKYDGLTAKQIETEKFDTMFAEVGGMKNARKIVKGNTKKRF